MTVFLPEKSHRQKILAGYSPWGHKDSDTTEHGELICCRLNVCFPHKSHTWNQEMFVLLPQHRIFDIHLCHSTYLYFIPFLPPHIHSLSLYIYIFFLNRLYFSGSQQLYYFLWPINILFVHWRPLGLFSPFGYCDYCCCERGYVSLCSHLCLWRWRVRGQLWYPPPDYVTHWLYCYAKRELHVQSEDFLNTFNSV